MMVRLLDQTQCELGEGPTYDPVANKAWWFDIVGKMLFEHDFSTDKTIIHPLPMMASMLGVIDEERQLLACEDGLYVRENKNGCLTLISALEPDNPATRSNDGRVHGSGALWIGTMGKSAEKEAGAIYWFYKGELRKLFGNLSIPNAICFSPDDTIAYFTDTATGLLMRVAIDPANGLVIGEPQLLHNHRGEKGGMDGAVVDRDGVIWNACWGAGSVNAYSPAGQIIKTIDVAARQPTCPAFVGEKLDQLLVTSAWQGMDEKRRAADEHAGRTFILDIDVKGRAEPRIAL